MEQIFLAIIFIVGTDVGFMPDALPRPADNMDICEVRREFTENYVKELNKSISPSLQKETVVMCGTVDEIAAKIKELRDNTSL